MKMSKTAVLCLAQRILSIKMDGKKNILQKRLVLSNLKVLHRLHIAKHPDNYIGFSKFTELFLSNCVLAGASGTHRVCVCVRACVRARARARVCVCVCVCVCTLSPKFQAHGGRCKFVKTDSRFRVALANV